MTFKDLLARAGYINTESTGHRTQEKEQLRRFWTDERFEDYLLNNPQPRTLHVLVWKATVLWFPAHFW